MNPPDLKRSVLDQTAPWENGHAQLSRKAAADGIVLLKNDGILPFSSNIRIALFGNGAEFTVKGGTGSGDVNCRHSVSILESLTCESCTITSMDWLQDYRERYLQARNKWKDDILAHGRNSDLDLFLYYSSMPFVFPEGRKIHSDDIAQADVAVYVIGRVSGEGIDRRYQPGDYQLSDAELRDIAFLKAAGLRIILMINAGGPVELGSLISDPAISAILFLSQLGQEGGRAICDVLFGRCCPSGKLTATWAVSYHDYPCAKAPKDNDIDLYQDGIYVGYRYFSTFGVKPAFPFGFGLSYAKFAFSTPKVSILSSDGIENDFEVSVTVTNNSQQYSGRQVVQVYALMPQASLPKEHLRLIGFAKTQMLAPGQSQRIIVRCSASTLSSFDSEKSIWILEKGMYGIAVASNSEDLLPAGKLCVSQTALLKQVRSICPMEERFKDTFTELAAPTVPLLSWPETVPVLQYQPLSTTQPHHTAREIEQKTEDILKKLSAEEWIPLLYGRLTDKTAALGGASVRVPGAAGETSADFSETIGLSSIIMADGPAGLRLQPEYEFDPENGHVVSGGMLAALEGGLFTDPAKHQGFLQCYQYCTAYPVGTALAQTWDLALVEEIGQAVAEELAYYGVSWWLAPGMNIQRDPLCGRNFEYFSEDPLLTGKIAAAMTRGVQSHPGCAVTIKHFACNNREDNRMGVNAVIHERTLREIYLRGFEIAVQEAAPQALMSSYNLINGIHAANNADLLTQVLRNEWGFEGFVMTDWTTTLPSGGSLPHLCVKAGNDLIMPGDIGDDNSIREALQTGKLTEQEVLTCARRLITAILRAQETF